MNRLRNPTTVLAAMYLAFVAALMMTSGELPLRVATHFGFNGQADGWMSRQFYLLFMLGFGLLFPLILPAIMTLLRWMPVSAFNLPNRDYWLAAERVTETRSYFVRHALWLSSLQVGLVIALHLLTVDANRQDPARLSSGIWLCTGVFLVGVGVWVWRLVRHFSRGPGLVDDGAKWGGA